MHIAVFYQYYNNPDCPATSRIYTHLCRWAAHHTVTLITTRTWYDKRITRQFDWVPEGVDVVMFDVPYDNTMNARQRLRAFVEFAIRAIRKGLSMPKPDVILGISTPLTAAWAASVVAKRRKVPWVFMVKDLWPDFPIQMGAIKNVWLQQRLYALERRLYHKAAHVVPFSPDMEAHILGHGIPPATVTAQFNGTDFSLLDAYSPPSITALREAHGLLGKRVILYGGAFGRANAIPTVTEAAERLAHRNDVQFVFIGHGFFTEHLRKTAQRLPNITLLPAQPRHQMLCWFKLADLSLVPFIDLPVLAANSPAKLFDSLGAGTPVVVTSPGWSKRFVETHQCGWYAPPSNAEALAQCLETALDDTEALKAAGHRGAAIARDLFDRDRMTDELESIFQRVVATP